MSEITVQFSPKHPMHLATDKESTRYALAGVQVEPCVLRDDGEPRNGIVCAATNGRILAVIKQEGECAETVIAPAECFKANKGQEVSVAKNGRWEKTAWKEKRGVRQDVTTNVLPDIEGRFPRYRDVLPNLEYQRTLAVTIDANLLLALQNSLRSDEETSCITMLIPVFTKPDDEAGMPHAMDADSNGIACVVRDGGVGVLMPCFAGDSRNDHDHSSQRAQYTEFVKSLGETPKPVT